MTTRILLFEFVCGGGCFEFPSFGSPAGPLREEGAAMLQSVAEELSKIPSVQIICPLDFRVQDSIHWKSIQRGPFVSVPVQNAASLRSVLEQQKQDCDFVIVIAPEIDNALQFLTEFFDDSEKLLTPGLNVVEIGSDKFKTFEFLQTYQIPTPDTYRGDSKDFPVFPMICKPRFGAGSFAVGTLFNKESVREHASKFGMKPADFICQSVAAGTSASIAVFRAPNEVIVLPAVEQVLDKETFEFAGCRDSLGPLLRDRARHLLDQVISYLPRFTGYLGIDIVLGEQSDDDKVIEINPRFTTSFCSTRHLIPQNCFEFLSKIHPAPREH